MKVNDSENSQCVDWVCKPTQVWGILYILCVMKGGVSLMSVLENGLEAQNSSDFEKFSFI